MKHLIRFAQLVLAITFIFSGLVKCIDPQGTAIKFTEYLQYFGLNFLTDVTPGMAWVLSILEFICGLSLLVGYGRLFALTVSTLLMALFTPLTLWLAITDAIEDCGCFGDAIHLSNWETFGKNVVLCLLLVLCWCRKSMLYRLFGRTLGTLYRYYSLGIVVWLCWLGSVREPFVDFRPYLPGVNLLAATVGEEQSSDQAHQSESWYTCIYRLNGVEQEFPLDSLPDEDLGWEFVETIEHQSAVADASSSHSLADNHIDFFVKDQNGELVTRQLLEHPGYTLLLLSPSLDTASQHDIDRIEQLWEYATDYDYPFYCITARDQQQYDNWRYNTGAEYDFLFTDASIVQTICRSNPGVMLLKDGIICWKQPLSQVDTKALTSAKLNEQTTEDTDENDPQKRFLWLLIWLFAPFILFLLYEIPKKVSTTLKKDSKDA